MDKNVQIGVIVVVFLVFLGVLFFLDFLVPPSKSLSVSVVNPVRVGYAEIVVESSSGLTDIAVTVGGLSAELDRSEGDRHFYKYFVSPYQGRDPVGLRPVEAKATAPNGEILSANAEMNISYFAVGDKFLDVTYFYYADPPSPDNPNVQYPLVNEYVLMKVFGSGDPNFFFEMDAGESSRNTEIINSFQSLIIKVTSNGANLSSYGVEVRDGHWVSCLDTESKSLSVEECERIAEAQPSIILRLPDYPTSQGFIHDNVIELQPAPGQTGLLVASFNEVISGDGSWLIQKDD